MRASQVKKENSIITISGKDTMNWNKLGPKPFINKTRRTNQMKAEHTPGPWRAVSGGPFITSDNGVIARTANSADEAVKYAEMVGSLSDKTNARLIAEAPALLRSLEAVTESLVYWASRNGDPGLATCPQVKRAKETIKRAKGETQ